jgi:hypothetical protein
MGENDGESRRFHLFGMKTSSLEPGLEVALLLGIPGCALGGVVDGRIHVGCIAAPHPTRQRKVGRKQCDMIGCGVALPVSRRPCGEGLVLLLNIHFFLISSVGID